METFKTNIMTFKEYFTWIIIMLFLGYCITSCKKPQNKILGEWAQAHSDLESGNYNVLTFNEAEYSQVQYVNGEVYRDYGTYNIVELTDNYYRLEGLQQTNYFFDKGMLWIDVTGYSNYIPYKKY